MALNPYAGPDALATYATGDGLPGNAIATRTPATEFAGDAVAVSIDPRGEVE